MCIFVHHLFAHIYIYIIWVFPKNRGNPPQIMNFNRVWNHHIFTIHFGEMVPLFLGKHMVLLSLPWCCSCGDLCRSSTFHMPMIPTVIGDLAKGPGPGVSCHVVC